MAIFPKPNLSQLGKAEYIYPYLLKNLSITESNQVWQIDITYIPMAKGFMYLADHQAVPGIRMAMIDVDLPQRVHLGP